MNRLEDSLPVLAIITFIGLLIGAIYLNYNYEKNFVETNDCHLTGNTRTEEYSYWVTTDATTGAGYMQFGEDTTYEYYCEVTGTNKWFSYRFDR
jgi:hypothetical protein